MRGYAFGGFRSPWLLPFVRQYRENQKLLLVRDPRDIAVSYYFSMAKSHALPKQGTAREAVLALRETALAEELSEYVLKGKVNPVIANLTTFVKHAELYPNMDIVRYEDIIFDKESLFDKICSMCALQLPPEERARIVKKHDIRPTEENPGAHVRQVTPGNYKKHLSPEAEGYLTERFHPVMKTLGYI
nr:sulfotransferase domain-containing protein [Acuticoccus kalidii]